MRSKLINLSPDRVSVQQLGLMGTGSTQTSVEIEYPQSYVWQMDQEASLCFTSHQTNSHKVLPQNTHVSFEVNPDEWKRWLCLMQQHQKHKLEETALKTRSFATRLLAELQNSSMVGRPKITTAAATWEHVWHRNHLHKNLSPSQSICQCFGSCR